MNDDRVREMYRQVLSRRVPSDRAGCVAPERLMSLVDRTGAEEERLRTLDHVMACPTCREEFEMIRAVSVAERPAAWRPSPALAVAATVVLLVGAAYWFRIGGRAEQDVFRGPGDGVTLLTPAGEVAPADVRRFTWRSAADSVSYLVEVLDADGSQAFAATTRDTTLTLPDSVSLSAGIAYQWWVRATMPDGSERRASLREFVIRP